MAKQFDNTNRGVLWKNDRKTKDNQPDYTGKINVDGRDLKLAAWIKDGDNGKYMSLSVSEQQDAAQQPSRSSSVQGFRPAARTPAPASKGDLDDDSIPF